MILDRLKKVETIYYFYALLLAAMVCKYFPFGIKYFLYSDDYCSFGIFHQQRARGFAELYRHYQLYAERPLAGVTDVLVITPLWNHMWAALLIMILLHFFSIVFLQRVFDSCKLPWGPAAAVFFGLYPLLAESTYWVNAAVRIVPGFFFLSLSAWLLSRFIQENKKIFLIFSIVSGVLSLGFYEQTVTLGFALFAVMLWSNKKNIAESKRRYLFTLPFFYACLIGVYYAVFFGGGKMAGRAAISGLGLFGQIKAALKAVYNLFAWEHVYNLASLADTEFRRFFGDLKTFAHMLVLFAFFSAALAFMLFVTTKTGQKPRTEKKAALLNAGYVLFCVIFLFFSAFGPFFILRDIMIRPRNVFFCVPAAAVLVQWLWSNAERSKKVKTVMCIAVCPVIFIFLLFNAAEVNGYKISGGADQIVGRSIIDATASAGGYESFDRIWVFGVKYQFEPHGAVHIIPTIWSDWGLTGMINVMADKRLITENGFYFNPIAEWHGYKINIEPSDLLLGLDEQMQAHVLFFDGNILRKNDSGEIFGSFAKDGDAYFFAPAN